MAFGKIGGKKLGSWKRGKHYLIAPEASFKLQICSGTFRVRIFSKEENISKPQISNKGKDEGDD